MTGAWQPWRALRERTHVVFALAPLPPDTGGAVYARRQARAAIVIDPALGRRQRKAALAHELVHDERGGGCDHPDMLPTWHPVVGRDENAVQDEVARRLVPANELLAFCRRQADVDGAVEAWHVGDEFDVPDVVAARALGMLGLRDGAAIQRITRRSAAGGSAIE